MNPALPGRSGAERKGGVKKIFLLIVISIIIAQPIRSHAAQAEYEYTAHDKFSRGILNVFTFLLEIPYTIVKMSYEENPVKGIGWGVPLGIGRAFFRLGTGLYELFTLPLPPFEPKSEPEYLFFEPVR